MATASAYRTFRTLAQAARALGEDGDVHDRVAERVRSGFRTRFVGDTLGALASIAGMAGVVWSIKRFADQGFTDGLAWASFAAGAAVLTWFARRCLRHENPMLDLRLFRSNPFTAGIVAATTFMFAMSALLLLAAQWLQVVEGFSPLQAGLAMLPAVLATGVASPLAPVLAARIGARAVLGGGLAVTGIGFLVIFLAPEITYGWMLAATILLGAGGASLAIGSALIMSGTPQDKAGNAAALEETGYEVGSVLGVAILGSVASAIYSSGIGTREAQDLGLTAAEADAARESVSGAATVAEETGAPELMTIAADAFNVALADTGLVGFILMTVAAVAVTALVPRGFDLSRGHH